MRVAYIGCRWVMTDAQWRCLGGRKAAISRGRVRVREVAGACSIGVSMVVTQKQSLRGSWRAQSASDKDTWFGSIVGSRLLPPWNACVQ